METSWNRALKNYIAVWHNNIWGYSNGKNEKEWLIEQMWKCGWGKMHLREWCWKKWGWKKYNA